MLPQCRHIYPDGHRCGRIPGRGQSHCPAHSRPQLLAAVPNPAPAAAPDPRPTPANDPASLLQMRDWSTRCAQMPFPELLHALSRSLCAVEIHMVASSNPHTRATFARAAIAIATVAERIAAAPASVPLRLPGPLVRRTGEQFSDLVIQSFLNLPE